MIWVLPVLAAMGVSAWIYNSVSEEEQRAQRQWHEKRRSVQKTLSEHRSHIERHIRQAQSSHDFHYLRPLQNTSLHLFADSQNPNTGFRLFPSPNTSCFTQIPP